MAHVGDVVKIKNVPNIQEWFRGKRAKVLGEEKHSLLVIIIGEVTPYQFTIRKEYVKVETKFGACPSAQKTMS